MIDDPTPSASAAAVARRVLDRLDGLLERLGEAYRTVPEYAALPPGVIEQEVLPISREIVAGFLRTAADGEASRTTLFPAASLSGRRRLEMGVPLEPMLHVYRIAGRLVFDEIAAVAGPTEKDELAMLGRAWIDYIDRASSVAATGYLEASHERLRHLDAQRGALLDSLLAATDASDAAAVAAEFSVTLASSYVVVLIAAPSVAAHVDRIAAAAPIGSVTGVRGTRVVVLAPHAVPMRELATGVPAATVAVGTASEPGLSLAADLRRTEALLAVALDRGVPGWYGPDDLLLDRLVAASPHVAQSLARLVLVPLRDGDRDGLVEATLRTYLRTGSIPETATVELVHPNTVTYRLRRVAERTGCDPRVPQEAAVLAVALGSSGPGFVVDSTTNPVQDGRSRKG
ncbi:MAG: helix-turn-helix domain-containing protein [Acidimicrobiales bacterium]